MSIPTTAHGASIHPGSHPVFQGRSHGRRGLVDSGPSRGIHHAHPASDGRRPGHGEGEYSRATHHRRGNGGRGPAGGEIRIRQGTAKVCGNSMRPRSASSRAPISAAASTWTARRPVSSPAGRTPRFHAWARPPVVQPRNVVVQETSRWRSSHDECQFRRPYRRARSLDHPPGAAGNAG